MKTYPTIGHWNEGILGAPIFGFDKLDGSNIRAEWSKKRSWYKFGTKRMMIDHTHDQFGEAVTLFMNKYAEDLERKFKDDKDMRKQLRFVVFVEFLGENSFAGFHEDEPHDVVLFDVNQHNKGILEPREFLKKFDDLHIPDLVYQGNYNKEFINAVKHNELEKHLKEGVVVKGSRLTKRKTQELIWMCKVKTHEWVKKVKERIGEQALANEFNGKLNLINDVE